MGYASASERTEEFMAWPATHYGHRVAECGEDGDIFAVSGHPGSRRALAAVLHYLRVDCGYNRDDMEFGQIKFDRRWVTVVDDEEEPWQWADHETSGANAVTYVETW